MELPIIIIGTGVISEGQRSIQYSALIDTDNVLMEEMLLAAKPTIAFLNNLDVLEYSSANQVLKSAGIDI